MIDGQKAKQQLDEAFRKFEVLDTQYHKLSNIKPTGNRQAHVRNIAVLKVFDDIEEVTKVIREIMPIVYPELRN